MFLSRCGPFSAGQPGQRKVLQIKLIFLESVVTGTAHSNYFQSQAPTKSFLGWYSFVSKSYCTEGTRTEYSVPYRTGVRNVLAVS